MCDVWCVCWVVCVCVWCGVWCGVWCSVPVPARRRCAIQNENPISRSIGKKNPNITYTKPVRHTTLHTPSTNANLQQNIPYYCVRTPRAVRRRLVHTGEIPPTRGDTHITWPMLHGSRGHLPSIRCELVRLGRGPLTLIHKLPEIPIIEMEAPARLALRPATILHPEVKVHTGIRRGELSLRLGYVATRPTLPRE